MSLRERALAWRHREIERACDRVEPWEHGVVSIASDIPDFWKFNQARVEGAPPLDADALAARCDELLAEFAHRFLEFDDERYAMSVAERFKQLGWLVERGVTMHLDGPPAESAMPVRAGDEEEVRPLRREWHLSEEWSGGDERMADDFLDAEDRLNARLDTRLLVADGPDGATVGFVRIRADGDGGEVAQAYLRPQHRGRGFGGALVAAGAEALRASGARDVWIVADDEDRPKRLYARVGFRPALISYELMRVPPR